MRNFSYSESPANHGYAGRSAQRYGAVYEWADVAAIEASLAINSCYTAQMAAITRLCTALGINRTIGRHALVRILHFAPDQRLTQFEIAAEMQVSSSNVTFLVDGLEKEGLVRRAPHPTDRRTVYVQLTDEGMQFAMRIVPSLARFMGEMLTGFSEDEKQTLGDLLERLRRNAESFDASKIEL
ncbi:MAG TPA: MarR family transcriptional regulator [Dehalococcoidia bacterium]|nr:MarR family transcriptional regulator [Dehalococcoidia bacterium]